MAEQMDQQRSNNIRDLLLHVRWHIAVAKVRIYCFTYLINQASSELLIFCYTGCFFYWSAQISVLKRKMFFQPKRIFCTSKISWNRISDWLPIVFHFGTENWADQSKKHPTFLFSISEEHSNTTNKKITLVACRAGDLVNLHSILHQG